MNLATKKVVGTLMIASMLAGCANMQGVTANADGSCNEGGSVAVGAVAGAILGAVLSKNDRAKGAATGAVLGGMLAGVACYAFNVNTVQQQTAVQVEKEVIKKKGRLPTAPAIVAYRTQLNTKKVSSDAPKFVLNSTITAVRGTEQNIKSLSEQLVMIDPSGAEIKSGSKSPSQAEGGTFENTFTVSLPAGSPQGNYTVKTNVLLNGKVVKTSSSTLSVAFDSAGVPFYALQDAR